MGGKETHLPVMGQGYGSASPFRVTRSVGGACRRIQLTYDTSGASEDLPHVSPAQATNVDWATSSQPFLMCLGGT